MNRESSSGEAELAPLFRGAFEEACLNLRILLPRDAQAILHEERNEWLPASRFWQVLAALERRYPTFDPILERIGMEMNRLWNLKGEDRFILKSGVDTLRNQANSVDYYKAVRGPPEAVGAFTLVYLDEKAGRARVISTTPFNRTVERGILIGGMLFPGDLAYVDVDNSVDPSVFEIEFH